MGVPKSVHLLMRENRRLTQVEQVGADMVIGADGVRSQACESVLGYVDKPMSSGYAVYRSW